jgi:hypothetical protein
MGTNKDIAERTERKLAEQTQEFNFLRDRCLVVAAFSMALITALFTFWSMIVPPFNYALIVCVLGNFVGVGFLICGAFSNPLNRGMDTSKIKEIVENEEDYYLYEIAYNLDSFNDNRTLLQSLQSKLNRGLTISIIIVVLESFCIFFNQIVHG